MKWTYGEEGERYPVQVGQVWRVGKHTFVCSDLMESDTYERFASGGPKPTLLYCDPPWNQGNVNSFRTKAGLKHVEYSYLDLYRRIAEVGARWGIPMYIEAGNREQKKVAEVLPNRHRASFDIFYDRKNPCTLLYAGPMPTPVKRSVITGMDDAHTPAEVMRAHGPTGLVTDVCGGIGYTATNAEEVGWSSLLNELHPNRVSVALDRVHKMTGEKPERVQ